ncbi:MAG: VWA domain-containing protein [Steroidobacteraceae bacterium]
MKLARRDAEVFSLSFLDCICCGFGAIILLLVLSEFGQPVVIEKSRKQLDGQVLALQKELHEIRGETAELNREMQGRVDRLRKEKLNLARVSGEISSVKGQFEASRQDAAVANIVEGELVAAYESLTEDLKQLQKQSRRRPPTEAVGGIPIDSEWIIFVIDTSGSMLSAHWETAQEVLKEILDIYPRVRGLQVLDDEGKPMFGGTRGQWLQDNPTQRARIVNTMRNWRAFSDSDPVQGIQEAVAKYWAIDKRISVYVIGDEFTGDSIQKALDAVDKANPPDANGRRRVRIHAIGFPEGPGMPPFTSIRFAALMRAMCDRNGGTFVPVTTEKACAGYIEVFGTRQCIGGG